VIEPVRMKTLAKRLMSTIALIIKSLAIKPMIALAIKPMTMLMTILEIERVITPILP
jgi:hypothetical protein